MIIDGLRYSISACLFGFPFVIFIQRFLKTNSPCDDCSIARAACQKGVRMKTAYEIVFDYGIDVM